MFISKFKNTIQSISTLVCTVAVASTTACAVAVAITFAGLLVSCDSSSDTKGNDSSNIKPYSEPTVKSDILYKDNLNNPKVEGVTYDTNSYSISGSTDLFYRLYCINNEYQELVADRYTGVEYYHSTRDASSTPRVDINGKPIVLDVSKVRNAN